jgi:hypothetical protein
MMLYAQEPNLPDTVVMKNGEILPCKIASLDTIKGTITIKLIDTNGIVVYQPMELDQVETYIFGKVNQEEEIETVQYRIDLRDGTRLYGKILSDNDSILVLELPNLGVLSIRKDKIDKMIPMDASKTLMKSLWFKNPHPTRLFFSPTAIPLKKGEGYYQNIYIVGNMFNYGVLDHLSIGAGFDFITMFGTINDGWNPVLNFNAKLGFKVHDYVHVGAGGLYVTRINEFSAGITYALSTFGTTNSNFTTGLGWGFVDGTFEEKPFVMLGGMVRCSEKIWFVTENWFAPIDQDEKYYIAISYGVRFSGKKISVDLGFINSKDIIELLVIGIPYVDFVVKFGK